MDLNGLVGKAKGMLSGHEDQAEQALEKARRVVKEKMPDQGDAVVDKVVDTAKDFIEKEKS